MGLSQIRRDRNTGLRAARGAERTLNRGVLAYAPLIERRLTHLLPARWRATGPSSSSRRSLARRAAGLPPRCPAPYQGLAIQRHQLADAVGAALVTKQLAYQAAGLPRPLMPHGHPHAAVATQP